MDADVFDWLTLSFTRLRGRRGILTSVVAGFAGIAGLSGLSLDSDLDTEAKRQKKKKRKNKKKGKKEKKKNCGECCSSNDCAANENCVLVDELGVCTCKPELQCGTAENPVCCQIDQVCPFTTCFFVS